MEVQPEGLMPSVQIKTSVSHSVTKFRELAEVCHKFTEYVKMSQ